MYIKLTKTFKDRGGRTLVHCVAGVSRSATLCMIYLVKHERMTLRQAYHFVKSARPVVKPNVGFWKQMIEYERKLKGFNFFSFDSTNCPIHFFSIVILKLKLKLKYLIGSV